MDVRDIRRDDTPKNLFNPLSKDFYTTMRGDDNVEVVYRMPSMEISTFPAYQAKNIAEDLITAIKNERGMGLVTEEEKNKLIKEIEVNING